MSMLSKYNMDINLTVREAAAKYQVSEKTISRWAKEGKVPYQKLPNGRVRYGYNGNNGYEDPNKIKINGMTIDKNTPEIAAINAVLQSTLPPAGGNFAVDPITQYVGIVQTVSRFYRNPDEAIRASPQNARQMFNNLQIREPLQARMLATAELPGQVECPDKKDPFQKHVCQTVQNIIDEIPDFLKFKYNLLYSIWFGKMANQLLYNWDYSKGFKRLVCNSWSPVHGDTLVPKWDSQDWGVYVGLYNGIQGTKAVTTEPAWISRAHVLDNTHEEKKLSLSERQAFVIHTHEHFPGEFLDPQSAGGVRGLGIRSVVYWTWYVMNEIAGWLIEYLERVGTGLTVYRYLRGNQESFNAVKQIAESQAFQGSIMFPVDPALGNAKIEDVERIEPSPIGIENMLKVLDDYYGSQIRRYLVGQDATSISSSHGLSNEDMTAEKTFNRLIKFDALNLADTLTRDLVKIIQDWTFGYLPFNLKYVINTDKPDMESTMKACFYAYQMGVSFDEEELRSITGLSKPDLDANIVKRSPENVSIEDNSANENGNIDKKLGSPKLPSGEGKLNIRPKTIL